MRTNLKTHSGNRIAVEIDGKVVGLMQSVRMNDSYGLEDASGIGDIHVQEHVPSKAVHALSVSNMALFVGNLRDAGFAPQNGDDALAGLVFDVVIYSKDTGKELRAYIGCSYDSGDLDIQAHRIVMQSGQLKALDVRGTLL
jgi:hypothetical protein